MNKIILEIDMDNLTEQERKEFLRLADKGTDSKKAWKPKVGDIYYKILAYDVEDEHWDNDEYDNEVYAIGNCFKTEKEAKFALEKAKVLAELYRYAEVHNDGEIDWNDESQVKSTIYFNHNKGKLGFETYSYYECPNLVYFTSRKIAENAVAEIGEDRIKKYLFGVED